MNKLTHGTARSRSLPLLVAAGMAFASLQAPFAQAGTLTYSKTSSTLTKTTSAQLAPNRITTTEENDAAKMGDEKPQVDFPATYVGRLLDEHMAASLNTGFDAEEKYQASLKLIRAYRDEAAKVLYDSYLNMDPSRYSKRWLLIETMRSLQSQAAAGLLYRVAAAAIPEETSDDEHMSSVDKEGNIRATAVDGLAELSALGNRTAESYLLRFINHSDLSVQRRAIRGYLATDKNFKERAAYLQSKLDPSSHALISLAVTNVKSVPHPDMPDDFHLESNDKSEPPSVK